MPLYEYRCDRCGAVSTALKTVSESQGPIVCERCGESARRIVSRPSVHRSKASKVERLDPRYDRMVDRAMARTQSAEPDHHLRRAKPFED